MVPLLFSLTKVLKVPNIQNKFTLQTISLTHNQQIPGAKGERGDLYQDLLKNVMLCPRFQVFFLLQIPTDVRKSCANSGFIGCSPTPEVSVQAGLAYENRLIS